jgi:hypothetical protein
MSNFPETSAETAVPPETPAPLVEPTESPSAPTFGSALVRAFRQPTFVVVVAVMLTAALGLNAAVSFMQLHFKKEPVPLAKPLGAIPERFGTWVQVSQDKALDKEMQDVLGTDEYIFRDYVDERVVPGAAETFKNLSDEDRRKKVGEIRSRFPNGVVSISVTYYTGMVDTVAHVPDRCVTADGYEPKSYETVKWPIARDLPSAAKHDGENIEVRYINFEDQTGASNVPRSISYFFNTNGKFVSSPLGVRGELANLWVKKGYYAKIETMTTISDSQQSAAVTTDFLTNALPDIYKCMPDWEKETGVKSAQASAK